METFIIQGGRKLTGTLPIVGAKNAATPILAATVLVEDDCVLHNVPAISDVTTMIDILVSMGARVTRHKSGTLTINCSRLNPETIDFDKVSRIRSSVFFMGCLAQRFGKIKISVPGGCNIGSRPLDAHFDAFRNLGYHCEAEDNFFIIEKRTNSKPQFVMKEFSVTATENVILASVLADSVVVKCCAAEHVVQDLCWFLEAAGARIDGIGTHTLSITGVAKLHGVEYAIMPDPIETGTFIALSAATHSELELTNAAPQFLDCEINKFEEIGMTYTVADERSDSLKHYTIATIRPHKKHTLQAIKKLHSMPYPGFAADLIQPFALLMTQAQGVSLIHDWMYDGRLRYVNELQKMGANITILDPHRIMVAGPTPLSAKEITSYDLRAGATLVLAALLAEGTSIIHGIDQVDRGYEALDARLRAVGALIRRK